MLWQAIRTNLFKFKNEKNQVVRSQPNLDHLNRCEAHPKIQFKEIKARMERSLKILLIDFKKPFN